jgi:hypothetical protein
VSCAGRGGCLPGHGELLQLEGLGRAGIEPGGGLEVPEPVERCVLLRLPAFVDVRDTGEAKDRADGLGAVTRSESWP